MSSIPGSGMLRPSAKSFHSRSHSTLPFRLRLAAPLALLVAVVATLVGPRPASAQNFIFVTSLEDKVSGIGGCSLQEAIYSATYKESVTITGYKADGTPIDGITGCVRGSTTEEDVIVLPSGATPAVFLMDKIVGDTLNPVGPTATPVITTNITIEANGAELQWVGSQPARAFAVLSTGHLTIRNAYIKGFHVKGGNGARGGGGGLGAGGAIFVKGGGLVIENSTFEGNGAVGGNGSANVQQDESGGGGGLGGNGGNPGQEGGGGGGGGSRGDGGKGNDGIGTKTFGIGGVGGGTLNNTGLLCGGAGGGIALQFTDTDGANGSCVGGGGGGGVGIGASLFFFSKSGKGGNGNYGGGGGGSGNPTTDGGNGGFGGGGGGGATAQSNLSGFGPYGGSGGYGGGGGSGGGGFLEIDAGPGGGGEWGGNASNNFGGGGGALGGAIFNHDGSVVIRNSTFSNNFVFRGNSGGAPAANGADAGGAIFSLHGRLSVEYSTISGNHSTGSRAGIEVSQPPLFIVYPETIFTLYNSIIANNGAQECSVDGPSVSMDGFGNLIVDNSGCPGVVTNSDPLLGPLQINQSFMPVLPIGTKSPAWNNAVPSSFLPSVDQRGQTRPQMGGLDIGAFELCVDRFLNPCQLPPLTAIPNTLKILVNPAGAGTTTPPVGDTSVFPNGVQALTATPNAGYAFLNWIGNVADPTNQVTAIVMTQDQTVTANFIPCTCAGNVSAAVSIKRLGFTLNPVTKRYAQTVSVTNNTVHSIVGPISLVLDNLSANATLFNATGTTDSLEQPAGSPYLDANGNLAPGQSVSFALQFTDLTNTAISYTTRVLAGPGAR